MKFYVQTVNLWLIEIIIGRMMLHLLMVVNIKIEVLCNMALYNSEDPYTKLLPKFAVSRMTVADSFEALVVFLPHFTAPYPTRP
jgi:hypothetical protein